MEQLQVLTEQTILNQNFKIYGTQEEPMFLAKDVADWIEHSRTSEMLKSIDDDEKLMQTILASGQNRQMWFLTEDGMYEVLMQSRKPIAKKFKKQVKEVLKDIRQHGMYATSQTVESMLSDPDTAIQLLQNYKEAKDKQAIAEMKVKELEPKADYYDLILKNKSLITITSIAKDYGVSSQAMNKTLNKLGVQYKQSNQWFLYAKHQAKGYTHSEPVEVPRSDGSVSVKMNTKWTQKGRIFLYKILKDHGYLPMIEQEMEGA
ncbi:phage antirepressor [Salinicoccus sesuvii]|uniref:Phage antirepressor n=1 Tax=Salinicoccus sesuvii TaxID=868281 RepID=A0ABV7N702_9STAP